MILPRYLTKMQKSQIGMSDSPDDKFRVIKSIKSIKKKEAKKYKKLACIKPVLLLTHGKHK